VRKAYTALEGKPPEKLLLEDVRGDDMGGTTFRYINKETGC
jgi:hypothetical protein